MDLKVILSEDRINEMTAKGLWPNKLLLDFLDTFIPIRLERMAFVICTKVFHATVTRMLVATTKHCGVQVVRSAARTMERTHSVTLVISEIR